MNISVAELREKVLAGVAKLGYEGDDAAIIADVLLYAQLRGNNQGITKIATGGVPAATEVERLRCVKETKCGALFSGGHSMVATVRAADKAVDLAADHGVGITAVNHTFTSSGALGYFARRISHASYIGFVCVGNGDWSAVAPFGSAQPRLGTNPLAYAFPYEGGEVVFDITTAAMAYFGVLQAKLTGEPLPEGVGLTHAGTPTTDAAQVLGTGDGEVVGGAITTFAGHKGYGFSVLVQLLGSAFAVAGFPGGHGADGSGTFVLAIDPGLFAGTQEYLRRSRELIESITSVPPIAGQKVLLPGQRGDLLAQQAETSGQTDIPEPIWNELLHFLDD